MKIKLIYKNESIYSFDENAINYYFAPAEDNIYYNEYIFLDKIRQEFTELYDKIYNKYYWEEQHIIQITKKEYDQFSILLCFQ